MGFPLREVSGVLTFLSGLLGAAAAQKGCVSFCRKTMISPITKRNFAREFFLRRSGLRPRVYTTAVERMYGVDAEHMRQR